MFIYELRKQYYVLEGSWIQWSEKISFQLLHNSFIKIKTYIYRRKSTKIYFSLYH